MRYTFPTCETSHRNKHFFILNTINVFQNVTVNGIIVFIYKDKMSVNLPYDFSNLFKYRQDLSDEGSIVMYKVSSRSCYEFMLNKWNEIMSRLNKNRAPVVDYIQISGSSDVIKKINCLRFKGRITPEKIFKVIEKKMNGCYGYEIEPSALQMNKVWCYRSGILVDNKSHGFTVIIYNTKK